MKLVINIKGRIKLWKAMGGKGIPAMKDLPCFKPIPYTESHMAGWQEITNEEDIKMVLKFITPHTYIRLP